MRKNQTRVYAKIDLEAIRSNMEAMQQHLASGTKIMGVVKADGYGHGAVPVAHAIAPYVHAYAVATAEEALELRHQGIEKPVLILGVVHKSYYEELIKEQIRLAVFTREQAVCLSEHAGTVGIPAVVHLALDTGMSRIGMTADEEGADLAKEIAALPGIQIEGLFTHFARADETDKSGAGRQFARYLHFTELLQARGIEIPLRHCANSAGIIDLPQTGLDMVRAGISIYGLYPSDEVEHDRVILKPAMELKSRITFIKPIEPGCQVSYGGTFVAEKDMRIATIPVGYADGYPRNLSGKGHVLIHGKQAKILGRICMDQFMADVTDIPEAREEDEVTLIGQDGESSILVEDLARLGGGFHYEIICGISKRVPRIY